MERLGLEMAMEGIEMSMKENLYMEIDQPLKENLATAEYWRKALDKVVLTVVVLQTTTYRAFDTESAGVSYSTRFIVDKSRGIILPNRHVVKPGPVVAKLCLKDTYGVFSEPVDINELPDYFEVIKQPMDFGTVRKKLIRLLFVVMRIEKVGDCTNR
ncbi:protease Do-like 7 [Phtheirospermum japonicum]|uniref:Protease Do-like 7 n=1 Tax=Phtheirospermum japonicum TaxID=374723 RepID=A0A830BUE6_9LAMI|nr:protease Do-like 7 [Phtheirospermum japonicum]